LKKVRDSIVGRNSIEITLDLEQKILEKEREIGSLKESMELFKNKEREDNKLALKEIKEKNAIEKGLLMQKIDSLLEKNSELHALEIAHMNCAE